jgi:GDP-L-fucose synthase
VDDLAAAVCFVMENYAGGEPLGNLLNVGIGEDLSIAELAELVARIVGYAGQIRFDPSRPNGTPRKLLDVSRIHSLGWRASITLEEGIASTYEWYCANAATTVAG